jgi:hypothetical protein
MNHRLRIAAMAMIASLMASAARADVTGMALGDLLRGSSAVVIGDVVSTTLASDGVTTLATIRVADVLAGSPPPSLVLGWQQADPEVPHPGAGGRLLLALRVQGGAGPVTHRPTSPANGLVPLSPATEAPTRALVAAAIAAGGTIAPVAALPFLRTTVPPPAAEVLAAMLDDLAARVGPGDAAPVADLACDDGQEYVRAARRFGLEHAGDAHSQEAMACARALLKTAKPTRRNPAGIDLDLAIAATQGIGNTLNPRNFRTIKQVMTGTLKVFTGPDDCTGTAGPLLQASSLSIAAMRDVRAASTLYKTALRRIDVPTSSAAVHALALIEDPSAPRRLERIVEKHPDQRIRQQASDTLAALR